MGIRFCQETHLEKPTLIADWPGIRNIGIIAVDTLRDMSGAEDFGKIGSWDFFYPKGYLIKNGIL